MADFRIAVNKTVGHEGGYVDDPKDFGGETKYGVSKRTYPNIDIIKLTLDGAREIYKRDFWDKMKLDDVDSQAIANEVFDTGVNCGWRVAATMLQNAINLFLVAAEAKDLLHTDGLVGSKTLKALRQVTRTPLNLDVMMKILNGYQLMHYINLVYVIL